MDASRCYIRMCKSIKTLQNKWLPQQGDWIFIGAYDCCRPIILTHLIDTPHYFDGENTFILPKDRDLYGIVWLPRVDQLHNMLNPSIEPYSALYLTYFTNFLRTVEKVVGDETPEKLWLRFVMHHNAKKYWCEGRWIKNINVFLLSTT